MKLLVLLLLMALGLLTGCTKSYPGDPEPPKQAEARPARRMDENGNTVTAPAQGEAPARTRGSAGDGR
jgi:hypothetical protein